MVRTWGREVRPLVTEPKAGQGGNVATEFDPIVAPAPKEVPLPDAPLVRVIAQVRFSPVLSVEKSDFVAPFQEAIRATYPLLHREHAQGVLLGPDGIQPGSKQVAWRFADDSDSWRVSLTPDFVALETTAYSSRSDFLDRMRLVLEAAQEHIRPSLARRVGMRYIDRVTGAPLDQVADLVRPEMLGIVKTPLYKHARHSVSRTLLDIPGADEQLSMQWGHLPAGATVDPNAVEAIDEPSWILDIDMFSVRDQPFVAASFVEDLGRFAERIYTLFRWSVTDEFLRRYGGRP